MNRPTAGATPVRKRPAPDGARTVSHQLRKLIDTIVEREEITAGEIARRSEIDPKLLSRFLAGKPGRGLTLATVDRIALAFPLKLTEGSDARARAGKGGRN